MMDDIELIWSFLKGLIRVTVAVIAILILAVIAWAVITSVTSPKPVVVHHYPAFVGSDGVVYNDPMQTPTVKEQQ